MRKRRFVAGLRQRKVHQKADCAVSGCVRTVFVARRRRSASTSLLAAQLTLAEV